jgi:hypothetical protein
MKWVHRNGGIKIPLKSRIANVVESRPNVAVELLAPLTESALCHGVISEFDLMCVEVLEKDDRVGGEDL